MVPIMNMFLVLIPFLLISSSFLNLKAINTSIPVKAPTSQADLEPDQSEVILTLMVTLDHQRVEVKPMASELPDSELEKLDFVVTSKKKSDKDQMFTEFTARLMELKQKYPNSNTMILSPTDTIPYEDMVRVMDAARGVDPENPLFAKVVISGILS